MTRFATRSTPSRQRLPDPRGPGARASVTRELQVLVLGALGLLVLSTLGCVSRGAYNEAVDERDTLSRQKASLEDRVRSLEVSNRSLDAERVKLLDELEDLSVRSESLQKSVSQLEKRKQQLEIDLGQREKLVQEQSAELEARRAEVAQLRGTYEELVADLESELQAGQIEIEQLREGLRVNLADEILFPSGSAKLNDQGREVLLKVAARLAEMPYRTQVEGHTDNVPLSAALSRVYPSNWELAGARAASVARLLVGAGVEPTRISAISYGEFRPVESNDTPEGRRRNRRIEIKLQPASEAKPTEVAQGATALESAAATR